MSNEYVDKITQAYKDGVLNKCMAKRLLRATESGVTDELFGSLVQDAKDASEFGVENDGDYNTYFFICHLTGDILKDTFGVDSCPEHKKDLHKYLFSNRNKDNYKLDNLTDYRLLIHKWLCDRMSKKAYPNTAGKDNREPTYDLDKWITTLKGVYKALKNKKTSRDIAINRFTNDWDSDEKQRFVNWMKYYEDRTTEKYNVKNAQLTKHAFDAELPIPQSWISRENKQDDRYMSTYKVDNEKTKREQELEAAKAFRAKMRSRLYSLKRLLNKYNDILPSQSLESVYDEIHALEKSISKLDVYASMQDCVVRSANRIEKFGFVEGANFLRAVAEPEPSVGKDVVESIPQGVSPDPNLPHSAPKFTVMTIINRLEGLSKALKSRDMIRELASIDILLNELGMASYFPELTDAQSKMIESFGYASNKIESIVAKLRGSGTSKPTQPPAPVQQLQKPVAPKPIDTGDVMMKPVEKVQKELPTKPER